jgi:hypothetical protein
MLRRFHLPNYCACCRASTWLKLPPKLNSSVLGMSHGPCAALDRRKTIRQRFARLGLFVFIAVPLLTKLRAARNARHEAIVGFVPLTRERDRATSFEGGETR